MSGVVWLCSACMEILFGSLDVEETCLGMLGPTECHLCGNARGREHQIRSGLFYAQVRRLAERAKPEKDDLTP